MGANKEKTIRFDDAIWDAIEKAAEAEGIDTSNYIRRCVTLYTREHHPELFERS